MSVVCNNIPEGMHELQVVHVVMVMAQAKLLRSTIAFPVKPIPSLSPHISRLGTREECARHFTLTTLLVSALTSLFFRHCQQRTLLLRDQHIDIHRQITAHHRTRKET